MNLVSIKGLSTVIILLSGGIGVFLPFLLKNGTNSMIPTFLLLCKIFSAGIILGTGFVHMFADAQDCFSNAYPYVNYPYPGFIAGLSCIILMAIEQLINRIFHNTSKKNHTNTIVIGKQKFTTKYDNINEHLIHDLDEQIENNNSRKSMEIGLREQLNSKYYSQYNSTIRTTLNNHNHSHVHGHEHEHEHENKHNHVHDNQNHPHNPHKLQHDIESNQHSNQHSNQQDVPTLLPTNGHCHPVNVIYEDNISLKKVITVYILELGIAIHSIIIGITMGTIEDEATFVSLFVALILHQFFEGIALGSSMTRADIMTANKSILMGLFFSLTTPIGIIIGIEISKSYSNESTESYLTQGIFNAISAGILIYMALIHLIIEDFNNNDIDCNIKICMFMSLLLGFGITSVIAIWA